MEWRPVWFERWPHTWDGGPHDWQVPSARARERLAAGADVVTAWTSDGVPHTVLECWSTGLAVLRHGPLPGRAPAYRLTAQGDARSLAVLPSFGARDPVVVHETWDRRPGAVASRHTGDIRERLWSAVPLPGPSPEQVDALWSPDAAPVDLVAALPAWCAAAEALPWSRHVSDGPERAEAVLAGLAARERAAALLAPPVRRGLLGRRRPAPDRYADPLALGSHDLERLLDATGRSFRVHRDDRSRVTREGEVELAVTVRTHPGLPLAVTGVVVRHTGTQAAWVAPAEGDLTARHADVLPDLLALAVEVLDGFAEEFREPPRDSFVPVDLPPPGWA